MAFSTSDENPNEARTVGQNGCFTRASSFGGGNLEITLTKPNRSVDRNEEHYDGFM